MVIIRSLRKNLMYNLHKNVYLFLKIVVAIRFLFIICDIQRDESEDNQALVSYLTISSEQTRTTDIEIHTNKNNYAISLSLSLSFSLSSKTVVDCLYRGHRSSFPRVPPAAYCVVLFDQDGYSMIRPPIVNGCPKASFHAPKDLSMYVVYSSSE